MKNYSIISRNAKLANQIYDTMTKREQSFITGGDTRSWYIQQKEYDKDNSIIVYSSLTLCNNRPVSFLDVFSIGGIGEISVGVKKSKRHMGLASNEVEKLIEWYKNNSNKLEILSWSVNVKNKSSIKLAEKYNFKRDPKRDFDEEWITYKL
mgnify:CR=1 FL=1